MKVEENEQVSVHYNIVPKDYELTIDNIVDETTL
jgi:hypothetical protein